MKILHNKGRETKGHIHCKWPFIFFIISSEIHGIVGKTTNPYDATTPFLLLARCFCNNNVFLFRHLLLTTYCLKRERERVLLRVNFILECHSYQSICILNTHIMYCCFSTLFSKTHNGVKKATRSNGIAKPKLILCTQKNTPT